MNDPLKPCPFCKSTSVCPSFKEGPEGLVHFVECLSCWANCGGNSSQEEAVKAWQQAGQQWQPIETAPKDGTRVVVASEVGVWVSTYEENVLGQVGWIGSSPNHPLSQPDFKMTPTHWQPLPAAPDTKGGAK